MKTHVLGSLQTISYSTHQDRAPVRSIGNINAKDYVQGQRTIAGTMVFAMFHEHWMTPLLEELESYVTNTDIWSDELPALNLTISMANEYGYKSNMAIYGVKFIDDGGVMSINDLYTENTLQYVATGIQPLKSSGQYQHSYNTKISPFKISQSSIPERHWTYGGVGTYEKQWTTKARPITIENENNTHEIYPFDLTATIDVPIRKGYDFVVDVYANEKKDHDIANFYLVNELGEKHITVKNPIRNIWTVTVPEGSYQIDAEDVYGNIYNKVWSLDVSENNSQLNVYVKKDNDYNYNKYSGGDYYGASSSDSDNKYLNGDYSDISVKESLGKNNPIICEVSDTNIKILSNDDHNHVSIKKVKEGNINNLFEDEITDESLILDIATNTSIGQSNSKEILIEDLDPGVKYLVNTFNLNTNEYSDGVTIKTFLTQKDVGIMLKEYIQSNADLLVNKSLLSFDYNSIKYEYSNIIDSILNSLEDSDEKTELLYYATRLQNELNKSFNDSGITSGIYLNNEEPMLNKIISDSSVKSILVFKRVKNKNYYVTKTPPVYNYQYTGKANTHYFYQPILINNKKGSRIDFVCFDEQQQDLLKDYNNTNNLFNLSFVNYSYFYNNYNEDLKNAIKAANNFILYKNMLPAPYAKLYNDTLLVDVDYREYSLNDCYLCIATPVDSLDYTPIKKIKFSNDEFSLELEKCKTGVLRNNYYLLWIQDSSFRNISSAFILSTYEDDIDIQDYYYNICNNYIKNIKSNIPDTIYSSHINTLMMNILADNTIKFKDLKYYIIQFLLSLYEEQMSPYVLDDIATNIINILSKDCGLKANAIYNNGLISFETDSSNFYTSCIYITSDNISKNSFVTDYDINTYSTGYTILFLTNNINNYNSGYILINNNTKEVYASNIELEMIKRGS
ncbi:MAG: hypothetical protein ACI3T9_02930 [Romboutsia timonensis]